MVREMKEVLQLLGWGDGFRLPIANEANKQLEQLVEDLLKRKAELMVNLETMAEKRGTITNNLKSAKYEQEQNQRILNSFSQQLNNEINSLKLTEANQKQISAEMKNLQQSVKEMDMNIEKLRSDIANQTNKMNWYKECLEWGEDALFAWESELSRTSHETELLETFLAEDQARFQKMDLERKKVEEELNEAKELERKEADRSRVLSLQLENVSKLYRESHNERDRLMKVWHDSVNLCHNREEENKNMTEAVCEVRNKARNKCAELFESQQFYEDIDKMTNEIRNEVNNYRAQNLKLKDSIIEIETSIKNYTLERDLRKKTAAHVSVKIESERMKNLELQNKNKARLSKYNKLLEAVTNLQEQIDILKVDTLTNEQKFRNVQDMYDMSCKASDEESREMERLYVFAVQLRQELNNLKEKEIIKRKEMSLAKKHEKDSEVALAETLKFLEETETSLSLVLTEEAVLQKQLLDLQDRCSGREEKEEIEAEIKELEPREGELTKENVILRMRLKNLQREYQDKMAKLKNGDEELSKLKELYKCHRMHLHGERKRVDELNTELQKNQLQLNLLLMREGSIKECVAGYDSKVGKLERQRLALQVAMTERRGEIERQREQLIAKKRVLQEERAVLARSLEHLTLRIKQLQAKYSLALDLLEKDESGKQLSIAHFKIKLAQEKYDLQCEGDDLEAKINKTEKEIQAMEHTLKLLGAANENYKISLESGNKDDPAVIETEAMERKYSRMKKVFKEDSELLGSVQNEIEALMEDISKVKCIAKELEEDWKVKEKEVNNLEKDLANKQQKLSRATSVLLKLNKDIKKIKEPPTYRRLAQKEMEVKLDEERNKSVLQQLFELSVHYVETKPLVNRYLSEYGLKLSPKSTSSRSLTSNYWSGVDGGFDEVNCTLQKEMEVKLDEERNKSVLQQLFELSVHYVETKPLVNRYLSEYGLKLSPKSTSSRSLTSNYWPDSARSRLSGRSDTSLAASVVNLDPGQLLSPAHGGGSTPSTSRTNYNKYL